MPYYTDSARFAKPHLGAAGDVIEIGVYCGTTSVHLNALARASRKRFVAVDSFQGMAEPGPRDSAEAYPKGKFATSLDTYVSKVGADAVIVQGWVPAVLDELADLKIAFCYLDLDHYEPTRAALRWVLERLSPGGAVLCDDYYPPGRGGATAALDEVLQPPADLDRDPHVLADARLQISRPESRNQILVEVRAD